MNGVHARGRLWIPALALLAIVIVASSGRLHEAVRDGAGAAGALIQRHPILGIGIFTLLAALSAMLFFFSSAVIVPVGVLQWGWFPTLALLWLGWLMGGAAAYAVGRFFGGRVVEVFIRPERFRYYQERVTAGAPFSAVLLFQAALPSEIPGYVLGLARYPFHVYLAALAIAELPYAIGAVFLGEGFIRRQYPLMIILGVAGIALSGWTFVRLHSVFAKGFSDRT